MICNSIIHKPRLRTRLCPSLSPIVSLEIKKLQPEGAAVYIRGISAYHVYTRIRLLSVRTEPSKMNARSGELSLTQRRVCYSLNMIYTR